MTTSELRVHRDAALALIVRIFVGAVAERWGVDPDTTDDLRLAASELFSGAVEAGGEGPAALRLTTGDGQLSLAAEGIPASAGSEDVPGGRFGLIRALFPDAEIGEQVTIRVPAAS